MRAFERIVQMCRDMSPEVRRLALLQMETIRLDFEAEDCFAFLEDLMAKERASVASQARRTYQQLLPQYYALRYQLRRPSSASDLGIWTEYSVDRLEIQQVKRLGMAQVQDHTGVEMDQFLRSGLHLLFPATSQLMDRLGQLPQAVLPVAIECLGYLATRPAVEELGVLAERSPSMVRAVGGALANAGTPEACQLLSELFAAATDPELVADLALELRAYPGGDTLELLTSRLNSEGTVRAGIAAALGAFDERATPFLARTLRDPDPTVTLFALAGLCRRPDRNLLPDLERCAGQSHPWISRLAIKAASATHDPAAQDLMERALTAPDPGVRALAIEGLIALKVSESTLLNRVSQLLEDPDPEVAARAALATLPVNSTRAMQKIRHLMASPDPLARRQGLWCLGYAHSKVSLNLLQQGIHREKDPPTLDGAVKALAKYEPRDVVEMLLHFIKYPNPVVRLNAIRILAFTKDRTLGKRVIPHVSRALSGEIDPAVRANIVRTISALGEPDQYLMLSRALKDPADVVVRAGIEGLDVLGNISSIPLVEPFLQDLRPAIRSQAYLALWNQGEVRIVKRMAEQLSLPDERQLTATVRSLSELLASLRRLEDSSKYMLLFSELKANMKSAGFQSVAATMGEVCVRDKSVEEMPQSFEFKAVVIPSTGDGAAVELERSGDAAPRENLASPLEVVDSMKEPDWRGNDGRLGFLSAGASPLTPEPVPTKPDTELELERLLDQVHRGDARAALPRLVELSREGKDSFVGMVLAQACTELAQLVATTQGGTLNTRAIEALVQAQSGGPDLLEPSLRLMELHRDRDRHQVYQHFHTAMSTALRLLTSQVDRIGQYLQSDQASMAAPIIAGLSRQLPNLTELNGCHGEMLYRAGELTAAFPHLRAAHVVDPENAMVTYMLARCAAQSGKKPLAVHLLNTLLENPSLSPDVRERVRGELAGMERA